LIRAANHSSYPRVGESPLDQGIRTALSRRDRGEIGDAEVRAIEDEVSTIVVAEQSRAFIDVVTDGMVRWEGPLSHVARHLRGMEPRDLVRWFDTNFYDRRPAIVGEVGHDGPFLVHDYAVAAAVGKKPVKVVLPGAVTFARLSRDLHYRDLAALARAIASALAEEVRALADAGATIFQLDEPLLCRHPEDAALVGETGRTVFAAAGEGATTILSSYFGTLRALSGSLASLPGTHLGLDMVADGAGWELLAALPPGRGVALGLFDARTTRQEDAADVAASLEPHRKHLEGRDVFVGPQAGLELLPRDQAFDKLLHSRYLVEKLAEDWK
jgi:5-methyltetrahydropteroyltriglutamate--homocysteine methyltransferase